MTDEFWTASGPKRILHPMNLSSQRLVIFGGSSGLGLGLARAALEAGAESVLIASRSAASLQSATIALGSPARLQTATADVSSEADVARVFTNAGPIDHIFTTAAQFAYQSVSEFDPAAARRAIDSKLIGALLLAKHGAPRLRPGGSLTLTSGIAAERPGPRGAITCTVNGALHSLVRALALELAPIRINVVSPGWVDTPAWDTIAGERKSAVQAELAQRLPVRRIGQPAELANAFLFLSQNHFATGTVLPIDGGHRFI